MKENIETDPEVFPVDIVYADSIYQQRVFIALVREAIARTIYLTEGMDRLFSEQAESITA